MGLFGDKTQERMDMYGLSDLSSKDKESVKRIMENLTGTGLMDAGLTLSFNASASDRIQIDYLKSIFEQNWIIIRQLDRIAKALER